MLKLVKTMLKIIEKAHGNDKAEQESSSKKKPREPAPNPTDTNTCRLFRHNHLWKNCPNNPNSKNYSGIHYSKIREQERAGMPAPSKNEDTSTKSNNESKRPRKKRHRHRERGEFSSINSDSTQRSNMARFSQVQDSIDSLHLESMVLRGHVF